MENKVFIGIPCYGAIVPQALPGLILATQHHGYTIQSESGSLLAMMFNKLWANALNARRTAGITHFAMHHADIEAPPGWLDLLMEEKERVGADIISVVVPIKDRRGLTSTGWQDPETQRIRRLTITEAKQLPETFCATHLIEEGHCNSKDQAQLVVNTGLWLCDIANPNCWANSVHFQILDAIIKDDTTNTYQARTLPEDWNFSAWANRNKLNLYATTKIAVNHHGNAAYPNSHVWGEWTTDLGDGPNQPEKAAHT